MCAGACAEIQRYGGSGNDVILDLAAGGGRTVITGYTESSDGTLSDRTKRGHSGWVMCMDAQGNVLWNFCSRHDVNDRIRHPVIHEDGTVSVILFSQNEADEQLSEEWIHLTPDGQVIERERIPGRGGIFFLPGERGYIQAETTAEGRRFYLIEWGGVQRRMIDFDTDADIQLDEASGAYVLAVSMDEGYQIFALDGQLRGREWVVRSGLPAERAYRHILALEDGGLAAIGRENEGFGTNYVFTRWNAEGVVLSDIALDTRDLPLWMCETGDGLLMLDFYGTLIRTDLNGNVLRQERIEVPGSARGMAALPDGRALIACRRGEEGQEDVWTTTVEAP